ncbi:MAG: hypothetical protein AAGA29_04905 [Planctomycetota bacterium]
MTATPILPSHPLSPFDTPSASAERRRELQLIEQEITGAAILAGWRHPRRRVFSRGHSIYVELRLTSRHRVVVRISDHAMSRPVGGAADQWPTFVVTADVPGALSHCIRWLEAEAEAFRSGTTTIHNAEVDDLPLERWATLRAMGVSIDDEADGYFASAGLAAESVVAA